MKTQPAHSRQDIEHLLSGTRPAGPGADLLERLRASQPSLPEQPERTSIRFLAWSSPLTAAAALVFGLHAAQTRSGPTISSDESPPADDSVTVSCLTEQEPQHYLLDTEDLGIVRDSLNRPVRLVRAVWFDENSWSRPGGPPELRESSLRQEIIPVMLPTH